MDIDYSHNHHRLPRQQKRQRLLQQSRKRQLRRRQRRRRRRHPPSEEGREVAVEDTRENQTIVPHRKREVVIVLGVALEKWGQPQQ